jgi:hypothetical protein
MVLTLAAYLSGCGTDSSSGDRSSESLQTSTRGVIVTTSSGAGPSGSNFSMRLTDAPVDGLTRVVVQFVAIEMKMQSGEWIKYSLPAPQQIDLLALQGMTRVDLLVNMPIKPGDYKQVRFIVDETPMANFVEMAGGGVADLEVPNGSTIGLKIRSKFTIPASKLVNFTVDFDLRRSVKQDRKSGQYSLKPKMRLLIDDNVNVIRGAVAPLLLIDPSCSDSNVDSHNAAYVYSGHNVVPDDINELSLTNVEPITTTIIKYDSSVGLYVYEAAFLPEDDYTIAFTCNADLEDLEADDDLKFFSVQQVNILVSDTIFLKP